MFKKQYFLEDFKMFSRKSLFVGLLSLSMISVVFVGTSFATTTSNTTVSNSVTVDYQVGGFAQTPKTANAAFVVDTKVDLTVTYNSGGNVNVSPGQLLPGADPAASVRYALTFSVTNVSNKALDFILSAGNTSGDNIDAGQWKLYSDAAFTSEITHTGSLAQDNGQKTVYLVATIPNDAVNGNLATLYLKAQASENGTDALAATSSTDANGLMTVEVVFADGHGLDDQDRDGMISARGTYSVVAPLLTVTKTSSVIEYPGGLTPAVNEVLKAIPNAKVRYTIHVTNTGTAAATTVSIVDSQPANTTYVAGTITLDTGSGAVAQTDADDAADGSKFAGGQLQVVIPNIAATNGSATVTFDVTIN
jgi:uncharacterized repeat protein (TIGR01451 family)